ncbi:hypothetical protein H7X87_00085 [Acetobacteraceae bacterium]|nr:hypothetical protein [Candidatus Parcubacteria bacterium]
MRTRRLERKRKHLEVRRITAPRQDKKVKAARPFVPAVLSLRHNEVLTPQFRKNRLAWSEAVTETVRIFEARGNWKYTARERVASELWGSLERSGYRFAQYKRGGFCLRFDLTDGRWRGDITPLTVSCTKDNTHPTYRRMRKILKERLTGLSQEEQHQRKALLWHEDSQIAA